LLSRSEGSTSRLWGALWLEIQARGTKGLLATFSPKEMSMCMWAAGKRRGQCEEGVVSLAREVARRRKEGGGLEGWVAGELCTVVWGASKSGISDEVWEGLVRAVCSETIAREVMSLV
jgi:hypothetical protein